jgi:hypothetical protein
MLSEKAINEFKQISFEENGKKITDSEAIEMGTNLLEAIKFVINPKSIYYED